MATRSRGRPPRHTQQLSVRLSTLLIAEIKTQHPELLKPLSTPPEFRHGALGSWLENILWKELRSGGKTHAAITPQVSSEGFRIPLVGQPPKPDGDDN